MCKGMGLRTYSCIITPDYNCMCKGKGLYDQSRISMPNCIHMYKGLGLFSRFYGVKCLLGYICHPCGIVGAVMPVFSQAKEFLALITITLYIKMSFLKDYMAKISSVEIKTLPTYLE